MLWVMECAEIKTPGELVVLYALADRADDDGRGAFPSQEWLARRSRCSTRSVRRRLGELESRGVICRGDQDLVAHYRPDRRPIVWDICMADGPVLTGGQIDRPDKSGRPTGQIGSNDRTRVSYKPSITILNRPVTIMLTLMRSGSHIRERWGSGKQPMHSPKRASAPPSKRSLPGHAGSLLIRICPRSGLSPTRQHG